MPAVPSCIIDPIRDQFHHLLPDREVGHPLGCNNPRIPEGVVFEKLVQVLIFGCVYEMIADESCLATTLRRRRDEWIKAGVVEKLHKMVLDAYDKMLGLDLSDVAVDCCITKAPCCGGKAGKSPVDGGKGGFKRSMVVDANGIPLGAVAAPANRHDSPLLEQTLDTMKIVGELPERISVHLDRGYDSKGTREHLQELGFRVEISQKGKPSPLAATKRPGRRRYGFLEQCPQKARLVYRAHRARHRLPARFLGGDHHRRQTYPKWPDPLLLGGQATPPTVAYRRGPLDL